MVISPWLVCRVAVCCATLRHLSVVIIIVKIVWTWSGSPSCQTDQEGDTVGNAPPGSMRFLITEETCLRVPAARKPPERRLRQPPMISFIRPLIVLDRWSTPQLIE